ncbi:hypothetical protein ACKWTF_014251 [Chironomus riparius]
MATRLSQEEFRLYFLMNCVKTISNGCSLSIWEHQGSISHSPITFFNRRPVNDELLSPNHISIKHFQLTSSDFSKSNHKIPQKSSIPSKISSLYTSNIPNRTSAPKTPETSHDYSTNPFTTLSITHSNPTLHQTSLILHVVNCYHYLKIKLELNQINTSIRTEIVFCTFIVFLLLKYFR